MKTLRIFALAAFVVGLALSPASAFLHAGSADVGMADMVSGGTPGTILKIEDLADVSNYAFDGSSVDIPFTLNGAGATVWLIIYTSGQTPPLTITGDGPGPYADSERISAGWHVYDGLDYLVYKSAGERFEEGAYTFTWNGQDNDVNNLSPGSYHLHLAAFDDEATPHVVGPVRRTTGSFIQVTIDPENSRIHDQVHIVNMANDWTEFDWSSFAASAGLDLWDQTTVYDACGGEGGKCSSVASMNPLGGNSYIGNTQRTPDLVRFEIDWDATQVLVDEEGGADNGG
jgi:hypothetical protein